MAIGGHDKVCKEVCDALGMKGKRVRSLTLRMAVNEVVVVEAAYYPDREQLAAVVPILEKFNLVPEEKG